MKESNKTILAVDNASFIDSTEVFLLPNAQTKINSSSAFNDRPWTKL